MSTATYAQQMKAVERQLKVALEAEDVEAIQVALRNMSKLQFRRAP